MVADNYSESGVMPPITWPSALSCMEISPASRNDQMRRKSVGWRSGRSSSAPVVVMPHCRARERYRSEGLKGPRVHSFHSEASVTALYQAA